MQKSPGSRALWRSGLFSLCAGALISLVLLRFLSQLDQPGLTPEDLRRSGAALALQILSISAAAIGFVTYTSPVPPGQPVPWYSAARRRDGS